MSRWGHLAHLVRAGAFLMFLGNTLVMLLRFNDASWKYIVYLIPANLGQGIVYPGILFTFLAAFDHAGAFLLPIPPFSFLFCRRIIFLTLFPDHAVSASTVYLIRSLGTVWGVAITSAIVQSTLKSGLPAALSGIPDKWKVNPSHIRKLTSRYHL